MFATILILLSSLPGCATTRWMLGLPPRESRPTQPEGPPHPASLAVVADVGGGYAGDIGREPSMGPPLASHPGFEASAGVGWRRDSHAVLFRARLDYAPSVAASTAVRAGAVGASFLYWDRIPVVKIPIEVELGGGLGAFAREGDAGTYLGLDVFTGMGVPLRPKRDLLLAVRISNIHSQSNTLSVFLPPFGNQQVLAFSLAVSWRLN